MAADSQPARQREPVGQRLKALLIGTPLLLLGLSALVAAVVWTLLGRKRGVAMPRGALVLALGGPLFGVFVAVGLSLVGIHGAMFGYAAFLACEIPAFVLAWLSRQTTLGKAGMITTATLTVASLVFLS